MISPLFDAKKFFLTRPLWGLALSLALAALGQALLAQQGHLGTLLLGALLFLAAILLLIQAQGQKPSPLKAPAFTPRWEVLCFALVFAEAALFRLVDLDGIPEGFNSDAANIGWWGLRILRGEDFPLLKDLHSYFIVPSPSYEAALWLRFFPPTRVSMVLFSVTMDLLSLPLIYWFFRQLAGARIALLTLALVAPMRWDITLCRQVHLSLDVHFWMFGCLALGYKALQSRNKWLWFLSAVFLAAGFYAYDAFKPLLPLVLALGFFEFRNGNPEIRRALPTLRACLLLFLVLSSPMWVSLFQSGSFGNPVDHLSVFEKAGKTGDWALPLENLLRTALMFNHKGGEKWSPFNLPGHRTLDDVTGALMVLGLGLGLWRLKERKYFYGWMGLAFMCLPAALSIHPNSEPRAVGASPFTAFFAACAMAEAGRILASSRSAPLRWGRWLLLAGALAVAAFENGRIYFVDMPRVPDYNWNNAIQQTFMGQSIAQDGGRNDYYVDAHFRENYTLRFLADAQSRQLYSLPWPVGPWPPAPLNGRGALFFLDSSQSGALGLLQDLYPHGTLQVFRDPGSGTGIYDYAVPAADLGPGLARAQSLRQSGAGLLGLYRSRGSTVSQVDPILNFAFREDFPAQDFPPLDVEWKGTLRVRQAGIYQFLLLGSDQVSLRLKGVEWLKDIGRESGPVTLQPGLYPLEVRYDKKESYWAALHLLWKKPGAGQFEVIPCEALQAAKAGAGGRN